MSLIKKLAGETAIYGVSSILSRILHYLLLTPYLTRVFAQSDYGIHSLMYSFAALLLILFTYGMETAFFRFGTKRKKSDTLSINNDSDVIDDFRKVDKSAAAFSTASISLFVSTILFVGFITLFSGEIASQLTKIADQRYVVWFGIIIGFDALAAIPFAKLRLENRPYKFAFLKIINILINAALIIFLLEICPRFLEGKGIGLIDLFYNSDLKLDYVFLANLVASGIILLLMLPEYLKIKLKFDVELWKEMFRYAMPLIIVGVAGVINRLVDRYLLMHLLPGDQLAKESVVGVYAASARLAVLMSLFITAFNYAAEPFFFKNANRKDSPEIYAKVGQMFALVGSIVFLGIALYIDVIQFILGKDFRSGVDVVPILLLAYLAFGMFYNFSIWYKITDKTRFGAYIAVVGAIITIVMNFILIPKMSFYGSAYAALTCFTFMALAAYFVGQKHYPIPYPMKKIGYYIGLAIAFFLISLKLNEYMGIEGWMLLVSNTVVLLGYLIIIYLTDGRELRQLIAKT